MVHNTSRRIGDRSRPSDRARTFLRYYRKTPCGRPLKPWRERRAERSRKRSDTNCSDTNCSNKKPCIRPGRMCGSNISTVRRCLDQFDSLHHSPELKRFLAFVFPNGFIGHDDKHAIRALEQHQPDISPALPGVATQCRCHGCRLLLVYGLSPMVESSKNLQVIILAYRRLGNG